MRREKIPPNLAELAADKRRELVECIAEVDDELAELFLADEPIDGETLKVRYRLFVLFLKHFYLAQGSHRIYRL